MSLTESELVNIREMLVDIQLALSSNHNTVTTDDVNAQPDKMHWRIDHAEHLEKTNKIANLLGIKLCSSPRCADGNNQIEKETNPQILKNLKKELESPDLQPEVRETLSHVIGCLTSTQTVESY